LDTLASLKIHPDKCSAKQATEAFQHLNESFTTLMDADQRRQHDEELQRKRRAHRKKGGRQQNRRR
jgi:curved DNA-binding protein CbpA